MEKELVYGFDIGIASTGSAVSDGKNIIYSSDCEGKLNIYLVEVDERKTIKA